MWGRRRVAAAWQRNDRIPGGRRFGRTGNGRRACAPGSGWPRGRWPSLACSSPSCGRRWATTALAFPSRWLSRSSPFCGSRRASARSGRGSSTSSRSISSRSSAMRPMRHRSEPVRVTCWTGKCGCSTGRRRPRGCRNGWAAARGMPVRSPTSASSGTGAGSSFPRGRVGDVLFGAADVLPGGGDHGEHLLLRRGALLPGADGAALARGGARRYDRCRPDHERRGAHPLRADALGPGLRVPGGAESARGDAIAPFRCVVPGDSHRAAPARTAAAGGGHLLQRLADVLVDLSGRALLRGHPGGRGRRGRLRFPVETALGNGPGARVAQRLWGARRRLAAWPRPPSRLPRPPARAGGRGADEMR